MPAGSIDFFNNVRVNSLAKGVYDPRLQAQPLIWDKRIPTRPAMDDEIMGRFIGFPMIADIIADDSKAVTYNNFKFQFYQNKIPKLKVGLEMNEATLKLLNRMQSGAVSNDEVGFFADWESRAVSTVRYGVDVRREVLLISMLLDGVSYDRLGIKIANTFGMYSDLKITPSTPWSNTGSTPITDITTLRRLARVRYGASYNRLTISTQTLLNITATTEFQTQSKNYVGQFLFGGPAPAAPVQADGYLSSLLSKILSGVPGNAAETGGVGPLTIELDDRRYWTQDASGVVTQAPMMPTAAAILTDSTNDNNSNVWDFANGTIIEAMVSNMPGVNAPAVPQGPGPTTYMTLATHDLNAPGYNYWAVQRGFPRKHMQAANAVITAGTYTDAISTALPF